jgi:rhodanese-related sulfurtransferase
MRLLASIACALAMLLAAAAEAGHGAYFPVLTIDPESLKRLLDERQPVVAVDLRPPAQQSAGKLPGARAIAPADLDRRAAELPRAGFVVLYCACPFDEVNRAYQALRRLRHDNVFVLEEGFSGWVARGYPLER